VAAFGLLDGAWWATLASVRLDERGMLPALCALSMPLFASALTRLEHALLLQRWRALSMLFCFSAGAP
jgi:hypothetical protein